MLNFKKISFLILAFALVFMFAVEKTNASTKLGDGTYDLVDGDKVILDNDLIIVPVYFSTGSGSSQFHNVKFDVYLGATKLTTTDSTRVGWSTKTFEAIAKLYDNFSAKYYFDVYVNQLGTTGGVWNSKITFKSGDVISPYIQSQDPVITKPSIDISNVNIKNITHNSATVQWNSSNVDISYILYGTENSSNGMNKVARNNFATSSHSLNLSGLLSNTTYYFYVVSNSGTSLIIESSIYSFTTKPSQNDQITNINQTSQSLAQGNTNELLSQINQLRNQVREQETQIKYLQNLTTELSRISATMQTAVNTFITYGVDDNTKRLGEGERAAVINSYQSAYGKLPNSESELNDVIKIANGRWPSITNFNAENRAKAEFKNIYKREANMNNSNDNAAVTIMAYGLRQRAENRNLNSESAGLKIFRGIYGRIPQSTNDWNILQAITYSGATR